jgi:hypothetical protein
MNQRFLSNYYRIIGSAILLAVGGCAKPMLSLSDVVVVNGGQTAIDALTEHSSPLGDVDELTGVDVEFFAGNQTLGQARTDPGGWARWSCHLPAGASSVRAKAVVDGRTVEAEGGVFAWDPNRTIIVCDIDETVSVTNYSALLAEGQDDLGSQPLPGAAKVMTELSKRFNVIYITGRPRFLLNKSRRWLKTHGFPAAPVVTAPTLNEAIRVQKFKGGQIADLRCLSSNLLIGIGNAKTDSEAYAANGLVTLIIDEGDTNRFRSHAIIVRDWEMIGRFFEANREVLEDPARLSSIIECEGMLLRPVRRYVP